MLGVRHWWRTVTVLGCSLGLITFYLQRGSRHKSAAAAKSHPPPLHARLIHRTGSRQTVKPAGRFSLSCRCQSSSEVSGSLHHTVVVSFSAAHAPTHENSRPHQKKQEGKPGGCLKKDSLTTMTKDPESKKSIRGQYPQNQREAA